MNLFSPSRELLDWPLLSASVTKRRARGALVFLVALQLSCSAVTDPAVHLAYCLEKTLKEHRGESGPIQATYELGVPGGCVVVLHPDGDLTNEQLIAAGLSQNQVEAVRGLRLGANAAIYVLSKDPKTPNSRTTYQGSFVRIPEVMVVAISTKTLEVNLAGAPENWFIESIE